MIDNYMYDIKHDTEFLIGDNEDQYHSYWWDDGEPLWISAVKQVRSTSGDIWPELFRPNCGKKNLSKSKSNLLKFYFSKKQK